MHRGTCEQIGLKWWMAQEKTKTKKKKKKKTVFCRRHCAVRRRRRRRRAKQVGNNTGKEKRSIKNADCHCSSESANHAPLIPTFPICSTLTVFTSLSCGRARVPRGPARPAVPLTYLATYAATVYCGGQ